MLGNQPEQYFAEEQAPHLSSVYLYIIEHDDGTQQFWTSYDKPILLVNVPTSVITAEEGLFIPGQIKHGAIASNDRFESRNVMLAVDSDDTRLRRFFVTAAAVKLRAWIIRVAVETVGESVDFTTQALIVESGILSKFGFNGESISAELTPEPFYVNHSIPRYFCQRQCNHQLYGEGCGLAKASFAFTTTIKSVDADERVIILDGQKPSAPADYFEAGMFFHPDTGLNFAIAWSAHDGADTKLKLGYWHPELVVAGAVTAYAGCKHTVDDCTNRFANQANFGGFPYVPAVNPVTNGIR